MSSAEQRTSFDPEGDRRFLFSDTKKLWWTSRHVKSINRNAHLK